MINKIDNNNYVESFNVAVGPELRIRGTYFRKLRGSSEELEPMKRSSVTTVTVINCVKNDKR